MLLVFIIVGVKPLNVETMRKITFFVMAAVAVLTATAQDNVPDAFDCQEAYWVSDFYPDELPMQVSVIIYHSKGDTVYDGEEWQKVYGCEVTQDDFRTLRLALDTYDYSLFGLTRKDGDKVYGVVLSDDLGDSFNEGASFLLYDFGADIGTEVTYPGDIWSPMMGDYAYIAEKGVETIYGYERRWYSIGRLYNCVEGVGEALIRGPFGVLFGITTGQNPHLLSCIVDGKTIFGVEDVVSLHALKYYYDPFIAQVDGASSIWTVGRVEGGKVMSTYTVVRGGSYWNATWECSASQQFESLDIEKRDTDLATIIIDGATRDLYDFGLDEGEVFDNGIVRLEVTNVDTAYFEGYERRVLTMDSGEQWIDGIGSTRGLLAPVTEPTEEYEEVLLSCRSGDVVMYVNPVYGSGIDERYTATATAYVSDGSLHVTSATAGEHTVSIVTMDGTEVVRTAFAGTELSLQLPDLPHGVYAVTVSGGGEVECRAKVVL